MKSAFSQKPDESTQYNVSSFFSSESFIEDISGRSECDGMVMLWKVCWYCVGVFMEVDADVFYVVWMWLEVEEIGIIKSYKNRYLIMDIPLVIHNMY